MKNWASLFLIFVATFANAQKNSLNNSSNRWVKISGKNFKSGHKYAKVKKSSVSPKLTSPSNAKLTGNRLKTKEDSSSTEPFWKHPIETIKRLAEDYKIEPFHNKKLSEKQKSIIKPENTGILDSVLETFNIPLVEKPNAAAVDKKGFYLENLVDKKDEDFDDEEHTLSFFEETETESLVSIMEKTVNPEELIEEPTISGVSKWSKPEGSVVDAKIFDKVVEKRQTEAAARRKSDLVKKYKEANSDIFSDSNSAANDKKLLIQNFMELGARSAKKTNSNNNNISSTEIQNMILKNVTDQKYYDNLLKSARCGDMFTVTNPKYHRYTFDKKPWIERIPVYNVGIISVKIRFDWKSGLKYTEKTRKLCNGQAGHHGDVCEIHCPKKADKMPRGQMDYDGDGKFNQFICQCSLNTESNDNDSICYWRPVEKSWKRDFTCNPKAKMSRSPREKFRLISWWDTDSKRAENRWNWSVNTYNRFYREPYIPRPDGIGSRNTEIDLYEKRPSHFDDDSQEENDLDDFTLTNAIWPNNNALEQSLQNDFLYSQYSSEMDILDQLEENERNNMQRFDHQKYKKMMHLAKLLHHYQRHEDSNHSSLKTLENFYKYGCHCFQSEAYLHKGQGNSNDFIDTACRNYDICTKCARLDNSESCHAYRGYQFSISTNETDNSIIHECRDIPEENENGSANSCRKSLCECDKKFVTDLLEFRDTYNENYHHISGFDSQAQCFSNCQMDPNNPGTCVKYDKCCNDKNGHRKPFWSDGGRMRCCDNRVYDSELGTCENGMVF